MIAILDYGMGNLRSVQKGLEKAGYQAEICSDPAVVAGSPGVVLPGVGAFADAMDNLRRSGLDQALRQVVNDGKPVLGICLGLQLFFESSEEWGDTRGLGFFPGQVRRFHGDLKVPHLGWNQVRITRPTPLFANLPDQSYFYFVHSYYVDPGEPELTIGTTDYGITFTSAVGSGNVYGLQFHPEKSSQAGSQVLANFGKLVGS